MQGRSGLVALVAAASSFGLLPEAYAYTVRTSTAGEPVRWGTPTVEVVLDATLAQVDPTAASAAAGAFGTWNAVHDAETPGVIAREGAVDDVGFRPSGTDNKNTVRYADKGSELAGGALAVTVLTFADDGRIVDADIILNGGSSRKFAVLSDAEPAGSGSGGDKNRYDVQNVLTHEVGHFFGLGEEESLDEATMFVTSARGETKKRDLSPDDELGVRSLYVPGSLAAAAEAAAAAAGSCSMPGGGPSPVPGALYVLAGSLVALFWARSRRRLAAPGAVIALTALLAPLGCSGTDTPRSHDDAADAMAEVTGVSARWQGGLIVTRLTVKTVDCAADECPEEATFEVLGGNASGFTQIVGHQAVPGVGTVIPIVLVHGQARWLHGIHRQPVDKRAPAPGDDERKSPATTLPTKAKNADPRRAHERAPVHLGVRLVGEGIELSGTTENLSQGGLFVAVEDAGARPAQGTEVEVVLEIPGRDSPLRATGEVRWVRRGGEAEPAGVGLRFVELEGEDAEAIRQLVEQEEIAG